MNKIMVIVGSHSIGDTLCSIPTIRHLSNVYDKNIHVYTYQPDLLKNYPYITLSDNYDIDVNNDEILIETFRPDLFVHSRTDIRQLHAMSAGFQLLPEEMNIDFYPNEYIPIENLPEKYIVIHPSKSWPSRTWEKERWQELINKLNNINISVVVIGKDSNEFGTYHIQKPVYSLDIKNGLDLTNKINIHQTWHVINNADMIITMDSGILHLAGTTDTYILQLGSSIEPRLRSPYRNGVQSYKYSYILGDCNKFCCSDLKYCIKYNNKHTVMPPVAFCLEHSESIGQDVDPDPNIYLCHPNVDKVFNEIVKNYNFTNNGKFMI